ncbi:beta-1,3-galactosyltransferase 1-like [Girardinichthys multiradiatus]|uniref:beta-1,3-galactosyltransferase 1-like n=1 Tax=Girardinichthys multiradiatus TaxID=208333 RepID=UPI001FAE17CD|nr:beta-1,3-galactosyltransferase 1-like [Girardinichthys multiradiatus]XP_047208841.1 beta-1,3-galactosyltransferase 1-like [Girardinichthys multiradiatus]
MESYHFKCEKAPWKGSRHWLYFAMLSLMMGVLIFYSWSSLTLLPSLGWREDSLSSYSDGNKTTAVEIISPHHLPSQFFVEYPHQYHFILDEPNRCRQESPFLVVIIPVAPQSREARDIIRSTWGKETQVFGQLVSYYFLLGKSRIGNDREPLDEQILLESQKHHDVLQSNFLDSYRNLTIKTMVMLEWLSTHCLNTSYAMKIDSDTFLNVHNLVNMLLKAPHHDYMTGLVARGATVLRDPNSKWFLSSNAFPESSYPPYALGLGYVFSLDLPKRLLEASRYVKAVYIEDVYVGLCMRHVGVPLTDPPHNGLFMITLNKPNVCYLASVITTLLQDSEQILDVWKVFKTQPRRDC